MSKLKKAFDAFYKQLEKLKEFKKVECKCDIEEKLCCEKHHTEIYEEVMQQEEEECDLHDDGSICNGCASMDKCFGSKEKPKAVYAYCALHLNYEAICPECEPKKKIEKLAPFEEAEHGISIGPSNEPIVDKINEIINHLNQ